jgi:O-Antigen ligase
LPTFLRQQKPSTLAQLSHKVAVVGLVLYVMFAPHSVAASTIGAALAVLGWLVRSVVTRKFGLRQSKFDLIILLLLFWTFFSALLSEEPYISISKLQASWCVVLFYLARAVVTRRSALTLVAILILSGSAGVVYSAYDLIRGRGVIVESLTPTSPFLQLDIQPGDTIWRIARKRVYSVGEIDDSLKSLPLNESISVSVISKGEHVERTGLTVSPDVKQSTSPSGLVGNLRNHHFRASGWTRHYETFAEILQMIAQLALGLAMANFRNHGVNRSFKVAILGAGLLTIGIVFTAMRTVLIAFVIGASVVAWRSLRGASKFVFTAALFLVLGFGAVVILQTRGDNALILGDASSSLRSQVARVGLRRIMIHPVFGHGMDAMKLHWNEWGFPGKDMLHLHSTPLQLAFDRGLPALILWVWMMIGFWIHISRSATAASDFSDTNTYGILLGTVGALTGFLASSFVNYNFGDSEVTMMFWWLMGVSITIGSDSLQTT